MSLSAIQNYNQKKENITLQIPNDLGIDINFSRIVSSITFSLAIDNNGISYIWGQWKEISSMFPGKDMLSTPTPVPGLPSIPCITVTCSFWLSSWLFEDDTAYVVGGEFSNVPKKIQVPSRISLICAGTKSLCVFGEFGLRVYTSLVDYTEYSIKNNYKVTQISSFRDTFALILETGELCTLKPIKSSSLTAPIRTDSLYNLAPFSTIKCCYITTNFGYFLVITTDYTVFIYNSDNADLLPFQLPESFPIPLINATIANGRVYFLDADQHLYVYPLSNKFIPEFSITPKDALVHSSLLFSCVSATNTAVYFIIGGYKPCILSSSLIPASLPGRYLPLFLDNILISPRGGESYGFKCGDRLFYNNQNLCFIGKHDNLFYALPFNYIYSADESTSKLSSKSYISEIQFSGSPVAIVIQDLKTMLIKMQLTGRPGADLDFNSCSFTIDRSNEEISKICCFKSGDTVINSQLNQGVILGVRANFLVVKYEKDVLLETPNSVKLIGREGKTVISGTTIEGENILIEKCSFHDISSGDIIFGEFGIGQFLGFKGEHVAIRFLSDDGKIRLILPSTKLLPLRTAKEMFNGLIGINLNSLTLSIQIHPKSNIQAEDLILYNGECARCVGFLNGKPLFETDKMLLENLGVGTLPEKKLSNPLMVQNSKTYDHSSKFGKINNLLPITHISPEYLDYAQKKTEPLQIAENIEIISKIGEKQNRTFGALTLSVNTDDFADTGYLPGDKILINQQIAVIVGISITNIDHEKHTKKTIYYKKDSSSKVEELSDKDIPVLIFRRFNSPISRTFQIGTKQQEARIDAEAFRGAWFWPGDIVEREKIRYIVYGFLGKHTFIVQCDGCDDYEIVVLNPIGFLKAQLIYRPFV